MSRQQTKGEVFAQLVSDDEVAWFLAGNTIADDASPPPLSEDERLAEFRELDSDEVVLDALRLYVRSVLPKPRGTYAADLWAISCLPSTHYRWFTLNCPAIEAAFANDDGEGVCVFAMNLSIEALPPPMWSEVLDRHQLHPSAIRPGNYRYLVANFAVPATQLDVVLADPDVFCAAREFVVRRMREGGTTFRSSASPSLAAAILAD